MRLLKSASATRWAWCQDQPTANSHQPFSRVLELSFRADWRLSYGTMEKFLDPRYLRKCGSLLGAVPLGPIDRHYYVQSTVSARLRSKLSRRLGMTQEK